MKKEDDSEKLRCLLDMVIKNCHCVKTVSFSYIFILFNKQTNRHHVTCLLACSAFSRIICGLLYYFFKLLMFYIIYIIQYKFFELIFFINDIFLIEL